MKYKYNAQTGLTRVKSKSKKYVVVVVSGFALAGSLAMPALAAKPADPGCFGTDRAAYIQGAQADQTSPGASEVGQILSQRAGTNGAINQAYKISCGGDPTANQACTKYRI